MLNNLKKKMLNSSKREKNPFDGMARIVSFLIAPNLQGIN